MVMGQSMFWIWCLLLNSLANSIVGILRWAPQTLYPIYGLYTVFDISAIAAEPDHAGEFGDSGTDSRGTDGGGLAAHGTRED